MSLIIWGRERRGSEFLYNVGHSDQHLCHFHGHIAELQEYPTWTGLSVSHSPLLGWLLSLLLGLKKKEKVLQDKSLSHWPVTRYMNHLYYGCDHRCCRRWFIPWWPHGSLTALPPGRLPGIHRDLSETPAVPPFCRRPQGWLPPLGFKPTMVSLGNNLILKSKVRNSKRSGAARQLSGDLQKYKEITKSLSDIFS